MNNHTLARKYCRRVRRRLPVGGEKKTMFLKDLRHQAEAWLLQRPHATVRDLESEFGTPEEIAADFIAEMSYQEIARKLRARNWILAITATTAILSLLVLTGAIMRVLYISAQEDTVTHLNTEHYGVISCMEVYHG